MRCPGSGRSPGLNLLGSEALLGLRLSDESMRHRGYQSQHRLASLRPSAAFSLVLLSDPGLEDVFLDPFCGSGTLLIERALSGRYGMLLGGDIDPAAIEAVKQNVGSRYQPIGLARWDATDLPLNPGSVDRIVTNLPFGRKIGSPEENVLLYERFFAEAGRVLKPDGRMAILTSERRLVGDNLARRPDLLLAESYPVSVLGRPATIYVLNGGCTS